MDDIWLQDYGDPFGVVDENIGVDNLYTLLNQTGWFFSFLFLFLLI